MDAAPAFKIAFPTAPPNVAGKPGPLTLKVTDAAGKVVTDFDTVHEKKLHLFVVSDAEGSKPRFSDFQHVHPEYQGDGTWKLDGFSFPRGGTGRLIADFSSRGQAGHAQSMLPVTGAGAALPDSSRGYSAKIAQSMPMGDALHAVVMITGPDGKPVSKVAPFLGADAHWAVLGDTGKPQLEAPMAHAHPMGKVNGGRLDFHVQLPQAANYQGWIQFQPENGDLVTIPLDIGAGGKTPGHGDHGGHEAP